MRKLNAQTAEPPLLLTVEQARGLLQIGRNQMIALVNSGKIEKVELGRSIRIPRQAVVKFVENMAKQAG